MAFPPRRAPHPLASTGWPPCWLVRCSVFFVRHSCPSSSPGTGIADDDAHSALYPASQSFLYSHPRCSPRPPRSGNKCLLLIPQALRRFFIVNSQPRFIVIFRTKGGVSGWVGWGHRTNTLPCAAILGDI